MSNSAKNVNQNSQRESEAKGGSGVSRRSIKAAINKMLRSADIRDIELIYFFVKELTKKDVAA